MVIRMLLAALSVLLVIAVPTSAQEREAVVESVTLEARADGTQEIVVRVRNSGALPFAPQGFAELTAPDLSSLGTFPIADQAKIAAGDVQTVSAGVWTPPDDYTGPVEIAVRLADPNARGRAAASVEPGGGVAVEDPPATGEATVLDDEEDAGNAPGHVAPDPDPDLASAGGLGSEDLAPTAERTSQPGGGILAVAVLLLVLVAGLLGVVLRRGTARH